MASPVSSVGGTYGNYLTTVPLNIQALLDKFGLTSQGSIEADKAAIAYARNYGYLCPPADVQTQLDALRLSSQGSLQADLAAIAYYEDLNTSSYSEEHQLDVMA